LIRELESDQIPDDEDPLARVGNRMRSVQQRIRKADSGGQTQKVQEDIVADLEEVLKALREKQKAAAHSPNPSPKPQTGERETPRSQETAGGRPGTARREQQPGQGEHQGGGPRQAPVGSMQRVPELLRDAATWGHLPEHQRQVLIRPRSCSSSRSTARCIEDYYTRLAQPNRE